MATTTTKYKVITFTNKEDYNTLKTTGTVTVDGVTYTYSPSDTIYCVPDETVTQQQLIDALATKVDNSQGILNSGKAMIVGSNGNLSPKDYFYVFEFDTVTYDGVTFTTTARAGSTYQAIIAALAENKNVYILSHVNTGADIIMTISEIGTYSDGRTINAVGTLYIFGQYFAGICLRIREDNTLSTIVTPLEQISGRTPLDLSSTPTDLSTLTPGAYDITTGGKICASNHTSSDNRISEVMQGSVLVTDGNYCFFVDDGATPCLVDIEGSAYTDWNKAELYNQKDVEDALIPYATKVYVDNAIGDIDTALTSIVSGGGVNGNS